MAKTILIADDDSTVVRLFNLDAESRDTNVAIRSSATGVDTIHAIEEHKPDILILDIRMPNGDGFSVLEHLEKKGVSIPVVILTNYNNPEYQKKSKTYGNVREYMIKHEVRMDRVFQTVSDYIA